jgi:hypothetical protein
MYEYLPLPKLSKMFNCMEYPSPSKVWRTLNAKENAIMQRMMKDRYSPLGKAVREGRKAHKTLEDNSAKDEYQQAILDIFNREIGIDIDEVWAKEKGVISKENKFRGQFDGVGVFRGKTTVWDYKKTNQIKSPSQMKNYVKQCAAYAIAHDEMYGTEIEQIAVLNIGGKTEEGLSTKVTTYDLNDGLKQMFLCDLQQYYRMTQTHEPLPF